MKLFNAKYKFFKRKTEDVQKMIWDLEFKVAKSRQLREGVRLDRDRMVESINMINARLQADLPKEDKEKLEGELAKCQENKDRYEKQMKMIDDEINGGTPTEYSPDGVGILERIKSLTELRLMYKEYMKTL